MLNQEKKEIYAQQVKKFMKKNDVHFIRNNERIRKKLRMNQIELAYALRYLDKIGFLEPWSDKVYEVSHN
jgi:hypothetical protein